MLTAKLFTSTTFTHLWSHSAMHLLRIAAQLIIPTLLWREVLPGVPLHLWFVLATLRMLVSRLPLVPNKDVVFAGIAVYLLGPEADVANLLTMLAGLMLAAHLLVGTGFGLAGLVGYLRTTRPIAKG